MGFSYLLIACGQARGLGTGRVGQGYDTEGLPWRSSRQRGGLVC